MQGPITTAKFLRKFWNGGIWKTLRSCEAHTQGTGRVCKCCVQSAGRRGGSPVRLQLAEVLGAPCAMDSSAGDEVHHVGDARDEGHHGAGDERHLGHHGPSGRRHWPHRKRHAAPFCREPRPTKARVRQRGGLLTRPPSRGRERQLERRGAMLNATCRLVVRQRSVAMEILGGEYVFTCIHSARKYTYNT